MKTQGYHYHHQRHHRDRYNFVLLLVVVLFAGLVDISSAFNDNNNNNYNNNNIYENEFEFENNNNLNINNENDRELQSSNPRVLGQAYECNEYLEPIGFNPNPRPIGYEIRICIMPTIRTAARDIVMRSIDEFTFYKEFGSTVQKVVSKGGIEGQDADSLNIVLCVPGQLICSLKAQLRNDFFYDKDSNPGNVTGSGQISFEYSQDYEPGRRNERILVQQRFELRGTPSSSSRSLVESAAGGYAGVDTVSVTFPVEGMPRPADDPLAAEENDYGWWKTAPTWLKVLVILGAIITLILLCCLCCMCMFSMRERNDDDKKDGSKKNDRGIDDAESNNYADDDYAAYTMDDDDTPEDDDDDDDDDDENKPNQDDICFDADEHPGTQDLHRVIKTALIEYPNVEYGPAQYKYIRSQLPNRRFFLIDDESNDPDGWRQSGKKELIGLLRKEYEFVQEQQQRKRR